MLGGIRLQERCRRRQHSTVERLEAIEDTQIISEFSWQEARRSGVIPRMNVDWNKRDLNRWDGRRSGYPALALRGGDRNNQILFRSPPTYGH